MGTDYRSIVETVAGAVRSPELQGRNRLLIDYVGVGRPVFDMFKEKGLEPVGIKVHEGDKVSGARRALSVPKRDLVVTLQVLLQDNRLAIAEGLPHAATLIDELRNFQVKISQAVVLQ